MSFTEESFGGPVDSVRDKVMDYLRRQGFFHVELNHLEPDLNNEISALFARENFTGIDEATWKKMNPALRLATKFIEDRRVLGWFWHQMMATPAIAPNLRKYLGKDPGKSSYGGNPTSKSLPV